jgi:hypothetical protein
MSAARAQRFFEAFWAAVHDIELEDEGFELYHFFDSDFLHRVIFGYRDGLNHELILDSQTHPRDSLAGQRLLMGALLGQGIGAPPLMRALPPHLYEVRLAVEHPWRDTRYSRDLLVERLWLKRHLDRLRDALHNGEPDAVLKLFLERGPRIFCGVELLSGTWESRLGRVLALGVHESNPFDDETQIGVGDAFDLLAGHVNRTGAEALDSGGVSGVRDAMALAMLAAGVARSAEQEPPFPVARFYTETPRIHRAWRHHEEVRAILTYGARGAAGSVPDHGVHGVLRTTDYYLIRALMPEFGYRRPSNGDSIPPMGGLGRELKETAEELRKGGLSETELAELRVGTTTLGEIMAEVRGLSHYDLAWRKLMSRVEPDLPAAIVDQFSDVLRQEQRRARDLDDQVAREIRELTSRTEHVAAFSKTYVRLLDLLRRWSGALRPYHGGYIEHFGLPRWGFIRDDCDEFALRELVDLFDEWLDEQRSSAATSLSARTRFVIDLTHRLGDIKSTPLEQPQRIGVEIALLAFLWFVGDYRSLVLYGERLLDGIELRLSGYARSHRGDDEFQRLARVAGALENMLAAAKLADMEVALQGATEQPESAAAHLAAAARDASDRLSKEQRRFPASAEAEAITRGYLLFQAWLAVNPEVMPHSGTAPTLHQPKLAREAFAICAAALDACAPGRPMYALLLNHCVYVAAVARLETDRVSELVPKLLANLKSDVWSYRMDDTLGYYFYARAAATAAALQDGVERDEARIISARKDVAAAEEWLNRVPERIGDPEVMGHRGLVRELEVLVEQLERSTAGM